MSALATSPTAPAAAANPDWRTTLKAICTEAPTRPVAKAMRTITVSASVRHLENGRLSPVKVHVRQVSQEEYGTFVEAAIVIAGTTGLVPLTGATLPLIAKGGTSVLTIILLFGILLGLSARREKEDYGL